jgi:hypothetical protein
MLAHMHPSLQWFACEPRPIFNGLAHPGSMSRTIQDPPRAQSPFARWRRYLHRRNVSCITSEGVTPPSSLIRAHAPDQNPPSDFASSTISKDLCRLSLVPAGSWPFPTLPLQSLRRCLDPYPVVSSRCLCPFLPRRQRSHVKGQTFDIPNVPCNATSTGTSSRGCSHSFMFRLPRSLDPQVAPTEVSQALGGRAVYATHISVGCLPRAVVSLRVRHGQLTRLDFHQLDCSTVGCYLQR